MPSSTRHALLATVIALCAAAPMAQAQTAATGTDPLGAPKVQQSGGGIRYISGGAGAEERAAMDAQRGEFPFKLVLSAGSGEYVVADKLSFSTPQGELLLVRDAGPVVMVKLPAGDYDVAISYQGKTERRKVRGTAGSQTLNVRFPG